MSRRRPRDPDLRGPGFWSGFYALAQRLYPRPFRQRMGADMRRTFARQLADAGARGGAPARAWFLARELGALPLRALGERYANRGGTPPPNARGGRPPTERIRTMMTELRQGMRRLARAPGFTTASILTLALGVGATTAVYSLVHSTVIDALPYPDSDELVWLDHAAPGIGAERGLTMTEGLYVHYSEATTRLESLAIWLETEVTLVSDRPERLEAAAVTPSFFETMRTPPALGRPFTDAQARDGVGVAVIGHGLWQRRFGGEPDAVGRTMRLDGRPVEIVGVMSRGFGFPEPAVEVWLPLWVDPSTSDFGGFSRGGVGRLAPGATADGARAELAASLPALPERFGPDMEAMLDETSLAPLLPALKAEVVRESERTLWILLGSVVFVLLLTCANVANLLLVRAEGRHRETALRRALGAGRAELVRYFTAEGFLLSVAGGALGVGLAALAVELLVAYGPADLPRLSEVTIGPAVVLAALLISFVTTIVFGLVPVLRRTPSLAHTIKSGDARASVGGGDARGRGALVATQVALALVLLVATGLMSRSFVNLATLDPGFDARGVLTFSVGVPASDYPDRASAVAFNRAAIDRLAALPGVEAVGVTTCLPLCGSWAGTQLEVEGRQPAPGEVPRVIAMRRINADYFDAMRIPLVAGRLPTPADHRAELPLAVLSERAVESYWSDEDPLGQRFRTGSDGAWFEVVGVVEDTPIREMSDDPPPIAYLPLLPGGAGFGSTYALEYAVRTDGSPLGLAMPAHEVFRSLDPDVPVAEVATLEGIVASSNVSTAFTMVVLAAAAGIALLLGLVGIYGVISYSAGQRAREIGIRMALGARSGDVSRSVLAQGGKVTAIGLAAGLAGALALTRVMESLLFGVSPTDPITFAAMPVLLLAVALAATWIPARRAANVDPIRTLRAD